MGEAQEKIDLICPKCGATFSTFLQQMAEHNQTVVCPRCAQAHHYNPSERHTHPRSKPACDE